MHSRSWYIGIVILSAFVVAVESIGVEGALNIANIDIFMTCAIPSIVGGFILVALDRKNTQQLIKELSRREWLFLTILTIAASLGVFGWFDAVGRIGAGKEAILGGGSSEVLFVVLLSAAFLSERLNRWEILGSFLILFGVFIVLFRSDTLSITLGLGETEAIASSFLLASSAVMITKLLKSHNVLPLSAIELIYSGIMLLILGLLISSDLSVDFNGWLILIGLGVFPAMGVYTYYQGLKGVGASITSVLFALNGIMTAATAAIILAIYPTASVILPENLGLAIVGALIAFVGVYLLNKKRSTSVTASGGHKI